MKTKLRKKNIPMTVLMTLFSIFCMYMIFMFSYQSAETSAGESRSLYDLFIKLLGGRTIISHNAFRKLAHFCEYAALGFSVFGTLFFSKRIYCVWSTLLFCQLYSISDEIHQYFVPDRACRIFDFFVDSGGILFGMIVFVLLAELILLVFKKRQNKVNKHML